MYIPLNLVECATPYYFNCDYIVCKKDLSSFKLIEAKLCNKNCTQNVIILKKIPKPNIFYNVITQTLINIIKNTVVYKISNINEITNIKYMENLTRLKIGNKCNDSKLNYNDLCNILNEFKKNSKIKSKLKSVSIYRIKFEKIPNEILSFEYIKTISINHNTILDINKCENILSSIKLTKLKIKNCAIKNIPTNIFTITTLEKLNMSYNSIVKIPKKIHKLSNLKYLNLSNNKIDLLPDEITKLSKLSTIDIRKNGNSDGKIYVTKNVLNFLIQIKYSQDIFHDKSTKVYPYKNNNLILK
jgi:Leucine-rich repeat (LRR) protein